MVNMKHYPIDKNGIDPLYVQLSKVVKRNINEGNLKPGEPIPSEATMMKSYQVSRNTVRNALLRLEYDGLLIKAHGRGTFVATQDMMTIASPFDSMEMQLQLKGIEVQHRLVEFHEVLPPEQIRQELKLSPRQKAIKIKRVVFAGGKSICLRTLFVPHHIGQAFKKEKIEKNSILGELKKCGHRAARMEIRIQASDIWDVDAEYMEADKNSTTLVRRLVVWDDQDKPILAGRVVYLAQYVSLKMEIKTDPNSAQCSVDEMMNDENWDDIS